MSKAEWFAVVKIFSFNYKNVMPQEKEPSKVTEPLLKCIEVQDTCW